MANVAAKIAGIGNVSILLTERGANFGCNTLVSDLRALPIWPAPTTLSFSTSSIQSSGQGTNSGGQREFVPPLARAAAKIDLPPYSSKPTETLTTPRVTAPI